MFNIIILILYLQADVMGAENQWNVEIPKSVTGLESSCVVVPCRYNYPDTSNKISRWNGRWYHDPGENFVFDHDSSKVHDNFQKRTSLVGELKDKNCSLKITDIKQNDKGQYWFRIMMDGYDSYSYSDHKVTISVRAEPVPPSLLAVKKEVKSGESVTVSCSVTHSCPPHPPIITWSREGSVKVQSEALTGGQHKLTSSLTFNPSALDHQRPITCAVQHNGGKIATSSIILRVTFAPVNTTIAPWEPSVLENTLIRLNCSAKGNPAVNSYQWYNERDHLIWQGESLTLYNVTRHYPTIRCAAKNSVGESKSRPMKINVEYPPEISSQSLCMKAHSGTECSCTVQSNPVAKVRWVWNNSRKESPGLQNGTTTMAMAVLPPGLPQVACFAANRHGEAMKILYVKNDLLYVFISVGVICPLMLFLTVICLWHRKRNRKQQQNGEKQNPKKTCESGNPIYDSQEMKQKTCSNWGEDLYGNDQVMQGDGDDNEEIYANNDYGCLEDDDVYANC